MGAIRSGMLPKLGPEFRHLVALYGGSEELALRHEALSTAAFRLFRAADRAERLGNADLAHKCESVASRIVAPLRDPNS